MRIWLKPFFFRTLAYGMFCLAFIATIAIAAEMQLPRFAAPVSLVIGGITLLFKVSKHQWDKEIHLSIHNSFCDDREPMLLSDGKRAECFAPPRVIFEVRNDSAFDVKIDCLLITAGNLLRDKHLVFHSKDKTVGRGNVASFDMLKAYRYLLNHADIDEGISIATSCIKEDLTCLFEIVKGNRTDLRLYAMVHNGDWKTSIILLEGEELLRHFSRIVKQSVWKDYWFPKEFQ